MGIDTYIDASGLVFCAEEITKGGTKKKMDMMMVVALGILAVIVLGGLALTESWEMILLFAIGAYMVTKVL